MENPLQLQYCPAGDTGNDTPLILIHDGGGTIFPYFRLGSLNRDVWAIHDPHFSTSDLWKGGIDEMAEHYMNSIKTAGIRGSVILGGWSLGGYISLAMAKILAGVASPAFCVTGLLLIDTPFHIPLSKLPPAGPDPEFNDLPDAVRTSFKNCDLLLDTWKLPDWETSACKGRTVRVTVRDKPFNVPDGSVLQKSLGEDWRIVEMRSYTDATPVAEQPTEPPPAVIMRCTWPTPNNSGSSEPCHIDRFRHEPLLRWDGSYPNFIKAVIDVDTAHYFLFDSAHADTTTKHLNECLEVLSNLTVL